MAKKTVVKWLDQFESVRRSLGSSDLDTFWPFCLNKHTLKNFIKMLERCFLLQDRLLWIFKLILDTLNSESRMIFYDIYWIQDKHVVQIPLSILSQAWC